jgi:hypothetical protein
VSALSYNSHALLNTVSLYGVHAHVRSAMTLCFQVLIIVLNVLVAALSSMLYIVLTYNGFMSLLLHFVCAYMLLTMQCAMLTQHLQLGS